MVWISIFTLECLFTLILLSFSISVFFGAPYYPTARKKVGKMIDAAKLTANDKIIELGSGDGRVLIEIAKRGHEVVGIEINLLMVIISRIKIFFSPYRNKIKVYWRNFWKFDATGYTVAFCYLFPITMDKVYEKLQKEMNVGSRIVSNSFKVNKASKSSEESNIFVYEI